MFGQSERINIDCNANKHLNIASSIRAVEETGKEDERLPVEIAIALDVSGSMHGEKIQLCKETIELLSKYLLPKDKLSITTFDTDVKQIFQLSEMTSQNKQNVEAVIKNVKAGSSTNLSGGLMDAIGVLKQSNVKNNVVKACILLTDGHANHGVRDMSKLANKLGVNTFCGMFDSTLSETIVNMFSKMDLIIANNVFNHSNDPLDFALGAKNLLSSNKIKKCRSI